MPMAAELSSSGASTVVLVPGPDPQVYFGKGLPIFCAFTLSDCLLQSAHRLLKEYCWELLFNIACPDREQCPLRRTHCGLIILHVMARCFVSSYINLSFASIDFQAGHLLRQSEANREDKSYNDVVPAFLHPSTLLPRGLIHFKPISDLHAQES